MIDAPMSFDSYSQIVNCNTRNSPIGVDHRLLSETLHVQTKCNVANAPLFQMKYNQSNKYE